MRNILVTTDFSNDSYNALFYASQLYKNEKCTFHILHAYDKQSHFKAEYKGINTTKKLAVFLKNRVDECLLKTYHRIITDTHTNNKHKFLMVPVNDLLENAAKFCVKQNNIDLIVMGTKGRTNALNIFIGGNTIKMVKNNIGCPILSIPKQKEFKPISNLGYITSYKNTINNKSLSPLKDLAIENNATLNVIHVCDDDNINTEQEKNKTFINHYFMDIPTCYHTISCKKSKAQTVAEFSKKKDIDLIAMCYYPHYFLDKLFREPVVLDLSIYSEIPLLVLPTNA